MTPYLRSVTFTVWCLWPACTWATAVTLGETLVGIPISSWTWVVILSLVSGLLALLNRMNSAVQLQEQIIRLTAEGEDAERLHRLRQTLSELQILSGWRLFMTWHMAGALVMGIIAFLVLEAGDANDYVEAALIALAAYGGSRVVDRTSRDLMNRVSAELGKKA